MGFRNVFLLFISYTLFFTSALASSDCCLSEKKETKNVEVSCPHHKGMKLSQNSHHQQHKKDKDQEGTNNRDKENHSDQKQCQSQCCKTIAKLPLKIRAPFALSMKSSSLQFYHSQRAPKNFHPKLLRPPTYS